MLETWKTIDGYSKYEVSDVGNVRSLPRLKLGNNRVGKNKKVGKRFYYKAPAKILKKISLATGYYGVNLTSEAGERTQFGIHRLVASSFLANPENKPQVNHKDGNKQNNHLSNLEWVTAKENSQHALNLGLSRAWHRGNRGLNTPSSKRTIQRDTDGNIIKVWDCALDAVRAEGFDSASISKCCYGKSKTHKGFRWEYAHSN